MAKNLSRTKLKQISDAWDAGLLAGNSKTIKRGGRQTILVYNATGGRLKPGDIVELKGFRASLTFDNAQSRVLNNNLVIKAVTPTTDSNSAALAAIDGVIEPGGVGRAVADIILAVVTFSSDSHIYVTAALTSTEEKSTFIVLAQSGASAGKRVCVLGRAGAGGEMTGAQILSKLNVRSLNFIQDVTFSTYDNGRYLAINKTTQVAVASIEAND
jgi:hypothetical protein